MIAKINTNKSYLDYFKNMLLRFFSCSKKSRDYVHYEMESSCLFYLSFNFDFYVSKIMHL